MACGERARIGFNLSMVWRASGACNDWNIVVLLLLWVSSSSSFPRSRSRCMGSLLSNPGPGPPVLSASKLQYSGKNISSSSSVIFRTPTGCSWAVRIPVFAALLTSFRKFGHGSSKAGVGVVVDAIKRSNEEGASRNLEKSSGRSM